MLERWVAPVLEDRALDPKMRFVAGPRQCGKTTLARTILARHRSEDLLFNWDVPETRRRYRQDTLFYRAAASRIDEPWLCFDEIHKQRQWKNVLKGIYDEDGERMRILVTGSARLELFRRAGDSLAGRFFLFQLSPILLGELVGRPTPRVPSGAREWIEERIEGSSAEDAFDQLLQYGPFPEPLLRSNRRFASLWRRNYLDAVVRGDIRDLTRIRDLDLVETLIELIPWRVGSPFSTNAVREDLDVAYSTVKGMMRHLERLLVTFALTPYTRKLTRPVKRETKVYLFEWSTIEDPAARFENLVALELLARTHLWTESGDAEWGLHFVRTREGKETDFLLTRNHRPWCLLECKLRKTRIESHHRLFAAKLGGIPVVQVVKQEGQIEAQQRDTVSISASRFLSS
jgi:predicted AAA+ superfamily ATPase